MKLQLPLASTGKETKSIGLDIGFYAIKLVELHSTSQGHEITHFATKEIPPNIEKRDRDKAIADLIKEMFAERKIRGHNVYIAVSGHNVVIRRAALPKMPREELIEAARWNAKEDVLFPVDNAAIDSYIMGDIEKEGVILNDVLSVIVRADIIPFVAAIVEKAGLKMLGITAIPIALWDYQNAVSPPAPGTTTCHVDMGAERTRVYFFCDNLLLFSREIPNGGKNITTALAGRYELEKGEVHVDNFRAEAIKMNHGLPAEDSDEKTQEGIPLTEIRERILPVLTKQAEELHRSIEYFKNQHKKDKVHKLVLSGGAIGLRGLYKFFSDNLEIEIERSNPLLQCRNTDSTFSEKDVKTLGPSLTTAAGLAFGRCERINVLPELYRTSLKKTLIKWAPWSGIPAVILLLILASSVLRGNIKALQTQIAEKEGLQARLQQEVIQAKIPQQTLADLKKGKETLEKERDQLPGKNRNAVDIAKVYDLFAQIVPENVALSKITFVSERKIPGAKKRKAAEEKKPEEKDNEQKNEQKKEVSESPEIFLQGNIFGEDETTLASLTDFLAQLNQSSLFAEVKLQYSEAMPAEIYTQPGIKFEILLTPAM